MAKKEAFHVVRIRKWIYAAVEKKKIHDGERLDSMTVYIEKVLLQFAEGKLIPASQSQTLPIVGEAIVERSTPRSEVHGENARKDEGTRRQHHRAG